MIEQTETTFNLIDAPWIGVRTTSGETAELSLIGVFSRAHELTELANDTPTQDFAILRLMLAVLQRAVLPMSEDYEYPSELWKDLWDAETLPIREIGAYLKMWYKRFDLFDSEAPFMQVAGMEATNGSVSEVRKLVADVPDGKPLFSLRSGKGLDALSFAEAARWLTHVHAFDTAGIKTGVKGDPTVKGGKSYPIGTGWAGRLGGVYLEGDTLMRTLLLNLVLCDDVLDGGFECFVDDCDLPAWELPPQQPGNSGRTPCGMADVYTWQSRRVRLLADNTHVTGVILSNGDKAEIYNQFGVEPMTGWRRSPNLEKKLRLQSVFVPSTHRSDRALWRGLTSILPEARDNQDVMSPSVVGWAGHLADGDNEGGSVLPEDYPLRIHATGVEYGVQSSVITELIDDTALISAYLLSPQGTIARYVVKESMNQTGKAVFELKKLARRLSLASGDDPERTASAQMAAEAEAYFELDGAFRQWLSSLGPHSNLAEEKQRWYDQARSLLLQRGGYLVDSVGPDAVVGRMVKTKAREEWESAAKAESAFRYWIERLLPREDKSDEQEGKEG